MACRQVGSLLELERTLHDTVQKSVLVCFHATWRGSPQGIDSDLERFCTTYPLVVVVKVNVEQLEDVAKKFHIRTLPTFKVFHDSMELDTVVGANTRQLEQLFQRHK